MKRLMWLICVLAVSACGSDSNPAAPAPVASGPPNVAGNYTGTITFNYISLGRQLSCPASTTVNQSGANISMAPLTIGGTCASFGVTSLPMGNDTISNTGSLGGGSFTGLFVASCNGFYDYTASGGFFGNSFQFSFLYTVKSGGCVSQLGNFSFNGTLSR